MRRAIRVLAALVAAAIAIAFTAMLGSSQKAYSERIVLGFGIDRDSSAPAGDKAFAKAVEAAIESMTTNANSMDLYEYELVPDDERDKLVGGGMDLVRHRSIAAHGSKGAGVGREGAAGGGEGSATDNSSSRPGGAFKGALFDMLDAGICLFDFKPEYAECLVKEILQTKDLAEHWEWDFLHEQTSGYGANEFSLRFSPSFDPSLVPALASATRGGASELRIGLDSDKESGRWRIPMFKADKGKSVTSILGLLAKNGDSGPAAKGRKELLVVSSGFDRSGNGTVSKINTECEKLKRGGIRARIAIDDAQDALAPFREGEGDRASFFEDGPNYYMLLSILKFEALNASERPTIARVDLGNRPLALAQGMSYDTETGTLVCDKPRVIDSETAAPLLRRAGELRAEEYYGLPRLLGLDEALYAVRQRQILDACVENDGDYNIFTSPTLVAVNPPDWKNLLVKALSSPGFLEAVRLSDPDSDMEGSTWKTELEPILKEILAGKSKTLWSPALSSPYAREAFMDLSGKAEAAPSLPLSIGMVYGDAESLGRKASISAACFLGNGQSDSVRDGKGATVELALKTSVSAEAFRVSVRERAAKGESRGIAILIGICLGLLALSRLLKRARFRPILLLVVAVSAFAYAGIRILPDILLGHDDQTRLAAFETGLDAYKASAANGAETMEAKAKALVSDIARASNASNSELARFSALALVSALFLIPTLVLGALSVSARPIIGRGPPGLAVVALVAILGAVGVALFFYFRFVGSIPAPRLASGNARLVLGAFALVPAALALIAVLAYSLIAGKRVNDALARGGYRVAAAPAIALAAQYGLAAAAGQLLYLWMLVTAAMAYFGGEGTTLWGWPAAIIIGGILLAAATPRRGAERERFNTGIS